ncbi:SMI1/KNR4 family protein [Achromobacter marplatensis]|uniref:SMI1/KNR4 family protein n=1 Tax=Achromobacter marplatensis TaxID=470868 RepID=UPI0028EB85FC|nr:SMI1/KNR4 family protein [Achromobacter marplatensis]
MAEYDLLAQAVEDAGNEVFWFGGVNQAQIERLKSILQTTLPHSFERFLEHYGGGGVVGAEISGIENNNAEMESGGTVLGDTRECQNRYALPNGLVVIYFHDDEVCWCLDTLKTTASECPVVSYDVFRRKVDRQISSDFSSFFKQHLALYGERI